jgi:ABC-type transport system involved in multi-copper enzyme maturation permease subunit
MWQATLEVIRFESKRTRTAGRIMLWLGLALFPALLMFLLQSQVEAEVIPDSTLALMSYYLVVQVGCMLGLLLWATPAVGAELEAQTWIYLAMRPHGKIAMLLGKYVVATLWTASAGLVSAGGVAVCSGFTDAPRLAAVLAGLVVMASVCYAALYILIGVAVQARATIVAVVYTLLIEGVLSTVPATINKFTVCYRLRALLVDWLDISLAGPEAEAIFGYEPAWQHLASLAVYTSVVLVIALWIMRTKEFPVASDT